MQKPNIGNIGLHIVTFNGSMIEWTVLSEILTEFGDIVTDMDNLADLVEFVDYQHWLVKNNQMASDRIVKMIAMLNKSGYARYGLSLMNCYNLYVSNGYIKPNIGQKSS